MPPQTFIFVLGFCVGCVFMDASYVTYAEAQEARCGTDSECMILCEKEKKRPCTDEDIFGPAEEE